MESSKSRNVYLQDNFNAFASTFPYLNGSSGLTFNSKHEIQPLYLHTFNTKYPSMVLLGTLTNVSFAYCDMQIMWALRVWLGLQQPPMQISAEMVKECDQNALCGTQDHLDLVHIYNDLADHSEMKPASQTFTAVMEHVFKSQKTALQSKNIKYNVISQQHWIVTDN